MMTERSALLLLLLCCTMEIVVNSSEYDYHYEEVPTTMGTVPPGNKGTTEGPTDEPTVEPGVTKHPHIRYACLAEIVCGSCFVDDCPPNSFESLQDCVNNTACSGEHCYLHDLRKQKEFEWIHLSQFSSGSQFEGTHFPSSNSALGIASHNEEVSLRCPTEQHLLLIDGEIANTNKTTCLNGTLQARRVECVDLKKKSKDDSCMVIERFVNLDTADDWEQDEADFFEVTTATSLGINGPFSHRVAQRICEARSKGSLPLPSRPHVSFMKRWFSQSSILHQDNPTFYIDLRFDADSRKFKNSLGDVRFDSSNTHWTNWIPGQPDLYEIRTQDTEYGQRGCAVAVKVGDDWMWNDELCGDIIAEHDDLTDSLPQPIIVCNVSTVNCRCNANTSWKTALNEKNHTRTVKCYDSGTGWSFGGCLYVVLKRNANETSTKTWRTHGLNKLSERTGWTYRQSKHICRKSFDGHIVLPRSKEENNEIRDILNEETKSIYLGNMQGYYLNLRSKGQSGIWKNSDGVVYYWNDWHSGAFDRSQNDHCATMSTSTSDNGTWFEAPCMARRWRAPLWELQSHTPNMIVCKVPRYRCFRGSTDQRELIEECAEWVRTIGFSVRNDAWIIHTGTASQRSVDFEHLCDRGNHIVVSEDYDYDININNNDYSGNEPRLYEEIEKKTCTRELDGFQVPSFCAGNICNIYYPLTTEETNIIPHGHVETPRGPTREAYEYEPVTLTCRGDLRAIINGRVQKSHIGETRCVNGLELQCGASWIWKEHNNTNIIFSAWPERFIYDGYDGERLKSDYESSKELCQLNQMRMLNSDLLDLSITANKSDTIEDLDPPVYTEYRRNDDGDFVDWYGKKLDESLLVRSARYDHDCVLMTTEGLVTANCSLTFPHTMTMCVKDENVRYVTPPVIVKAKSIQRQWTALEIGLLVFLLLLIVGSVVLATIYFKPCKRIKTQPMSVIWARGRRSDNVEIVRKSTSASMVTN